MARLQIDVTKTRAYQELFKKIVSRLPKELPEEVKTSDDLYDWAGEFVSQDVNMASTMFLALIEDSPKWEQELDELLMDVGMSMAADVDQEVRRRLRLEQKVLEADLERCKSILAE